MKLRVLIACVLSSILLTPMAYSADCPLFVRLLAHDAARKLVKTRFRSDVAIYATKSAVIPQTTFDDPEPFTPIDFKIHLRLGVNEGVHRLGFVEVTTFSEGSKEDARRAVMKVESKDQAKNPRKLTEADLKHYIEYAVWDLAQLNNSEGRPNSEMFPTRIIRIKGSEGGKGKFEVTVPAIQMLKDQDIKTPKVIVTVDPKKLQFIRAMSLLPVELPHEPAHTQQHDFVRIGRSTPGRVVLRP